MAEPAQGELIDCAIGPGAQLEKVCVLEVVGDSGEFVIRHPDGGFRRFGSDLRGGHQTMDGADQLTASYGFGVDHVEFRVGDDRYSMPLSILPERAGE